MYDFKEFILAIVLFLSPLLLLLGLSPLINKKNKKTYKHDLYDPVPFKEEPSFPDFNSPPPKMVCIYNNGKLVEIIKPKKKSAKPKKKTKKKPRK